MSDLWVLVEGGGSRTWMALTDGAAIVAEATGRSTSPRSVGEERALHCLAALLSDILPTDLEPRFAGVIAAHGAASTYAAAADFADLVDKALIRALGEATVPVLIINDIALPLTSVDGPVCAVICGTGTSIAARTSTTVARASGMEWLLSDEGGGFDLAVSGLRAVIRAGDGRGPSTSLTTAARIWADDPDRPLHEALFDAVYSYFTKEHVATFAPAVFAAADEHDAVAVQLLENASGELARGAFATARTAGITSSTRLTLVLSGSLLVEVPHLRTRLEDRLTPTLGVFETRQHTHHGRAAAALALLREWTGDTDSFRELVRALPSSQRRPTEAAT